MTPLTAQEEAKFRESVRLIGDDSETYGDWWSNHTAMRLLATIDALRGGHVTEPRDTTTDDTPEPRDDDTGETASDDEAPDAPTTPKE